MKNILYWLIGVMVVTGVIAFAIAITRPEVQEEEVVAYDDDLYPSELRPVNDDASDTNVTYDPDILLDSEELTPDEDFVEFEDVEPEEPEEPEVQDEVETAEDTAPAEPKPKEEVSEAVPLTKETLPPGTPIIINRRSNIRKAPANDQKILTVLPAGDIGEMVEAGEGWSVIKCGETQGYVHNSCWDIYTAPAE